MGAENAAHTSGACAGIHAGHPLCRTLTSPSCCPHFTDKDAEAQSNWWSWDSMTATQTKHRLGQLPDPSGLHSMGSCDPPQPQPCLPGLLLQEAFLNAPSAMSLGPLAWGYRHQWGSANPGANLALF